MEIHLQILSQEEVVFRRTLLPTAATDNIKMLQIAVSDTTDTSEDPAMALWDLIHNHDAAEAVAEAPNSNENERIADASLPRKTVTGITPRFAESQQNRTLTHPLLPQPYRDVMPSLSLGDQVKVLMQQGVRAEDSDAVCQTVGMQDMPSPTSTLQVPHCDHDVNKVLPQHLFDVSAKLAEQCVVEEGITEMERQSQSHSFVVCADTQLGMRDKNQSWEFELEISRRTVRKINAMNPLPRFVCVCGDLIDMEESFYRNSQEFSLDRCHEIQDQQNRDFQEVWSKLDERVAIVCMCGNHDVGNRPNRTSISRFTKSFGDDYLSFWCNKSFNIVINTSLFSDPEDAQDLFRDQLRWLENELTYAHENGADQIFCFGHHPWFLYNENEVKEDLPGKVAFPSEWGEPPSEDAGFPDWYFHIKREYRVIALDLFKKYGVAASFCGHFHQNLVAKTSFGMEHVVTGPLSMIFDSSGKSGHYRDEFNSNGFRVVEVGEREFTHHFVPL